MDQLLVRIHYMIALLCVNYPLYYFIGEDYKSTSYAVVILAGVTSVSFDISITNDTIFEGNESFNLSINPDFLLNNVSIGDYGEATVEIIDDDGN